MYRHTPWSCTAAFFFALYAETFAGCAHSEPPPPPQLRSSPHPSPPQPTDMNGVPMHGDREDWVRLPIVISYPPGNSQLDDTALATLREFHAVAHNRSDIVYIRVEGYADGQGSSEANDALATELAEGVIDFMVDDLGMPRQLFQLASNGENRRLNSETPLIDRAQDRFVLFSIHVRRQSVP